MEGFPDYGQIVPDLSGGFSRSMQHQAEVYLQDFERPNSFANVDLKKTQPCLGQIEDSQKSGSSLKAL